MTDQTPTTPHQGWQPTVSTTAGALIGGAIAQLICASLVQFAHLSPSAQTVASITTLCVAACGYFFPDGGRR